jgi:hypothetical protein
MAPRKKELMSALVVLRSASGKAPGGATAVTAENVREYLPAASSADEARRAFAAAGFEVTEVVGNSFSITAPASVFEKAFKVKLRREEGKGVTAQADADADAGYEIPANKLPASLARHVAAVTFTPPPDFGPTNYS